MFVKSDFETLELILNKLMLNRVFDMKKLIAENYEFSVQKSYDDSNVINIQLEISYVAVFCARKCTF